MIYGKLDNIETTGFASRSGVAGAGSSAGSAGSGPGGGSEQPVNQLFKSEGSKTIPVTALIISGLIFGIAIYLYYR